MPIPSAPLVDIVLAYRLAYYCHARPLASDADYDVAEIEARKLVPANHALNRPGSDRIDDYPPSIRALALYLTLRAHEAHLAEQGAIKGISMPGAKAQEDELDIPE